MSTLLLQGKEAVYNNPIIEKRTLTLNIRVKPQNNEQQKHVESLLTNNILQDSNKSNISFRINDEKEIKTIKPIKKINLIKNEKKEISKIIKKRIDKPEVGANIIKEEPMREPPKEDDDDILVKKMRIMGEYYLVGVDQPFIYSIETGEKVGEILDNLNVCWITQ